MLVLVWLCVGMDVDVCLDVSEVMGISVCVCVGLDVGVGVGVGIGVGVDIGKVWVSRRVYFVSSIFNFLMS